MKRPLLPVLPLIIVAAVVAVLAEHSNRCVAAVSTIPEYGRARISCAYLFHDDENASGVVEAANDAQIHGIY